MLLVITTGLKIVTVLAVLVDASVEKRKKRFNFLKFPALGQQSNVDVRHDLELG